MLTGRLPLSGLQVTVRPPTGVEDLLLREARELNAALAFQLLDCLVSAPHGTAVNWRELAVTDYEVLLLLLHRAAMGEVVRAEANCAEVECGTRIDVSFTVSDYLASQTPRTPRGVERMNQPGSYRLAGDAVEFRVPNGGDLLAIEITPDAERERELIRRCVQRESVGPRLRRKIDHAVDALAPRLSRTLAGECPECHAPMNFYFDVQQFVLRELRDHAASVYEDVHLLAFHYKWTEEDILRLPRSRRAHYTEAVRSWSTA